MILTLLIFVSPLGLANARERNHNQLEVDSKLQDNVTRKLRRVERAPVYPYHFFNNNDNNVNNDNNDNDNAMKKLHRRKRSAVNPYHICAICRTRAGDKKSKIWKSNTLGRLARKYHNNSLFSLIQL